MIDYQINLLDKTAIPPLADRLRAVAKAARFDNADPTDFSRVFVISVNGTVVAYAGLACYRGHWCLRSCVVHPKWRGKGFQRQLIDIRLAFLREHTKAKHVNVWVRPDNVYSLNNLVSDGFRFVPEKPREFKGHMHVKLRRTLTP